MAVRGSKIASRRAGAPLVMPLLFLMALSWLIAVARVPERGSAARVAIPSGHVRALNRVPRPRPDQPPTRAVNRSFRQPSLPRVAASRVSIGNRSRHHRSNLDTVGCAVVNMGEGPAFGYPSWLPGDEIMAWMVPACAPDSSYRLDSVEVLLADAAAFGLPDGAGTLEFRVHLICSRDGDPCTGPQHGLWSSPVQPFTTDGTLGVIGWTVPVGVCLHDPLFVAVEIVSWSGLPQRVPTPVWDRFNITDCPQWVCLGSCLPFALFFPSGEDGRIGLIAYLHPDTCAASVCPEPCALIEPPGAIPEGEPLCDDGYEDEWNAGCADTPPQLQTIQCGDTIVAQSGTFLVNEQPVMDWDWYRVAVADTAALSVGAVAEFPVQVRVYSGAGGCLSPVILAATDPMAEPCDSFTASLSVPAGEYWVSVNSHLWEGVRCDSRYLLWVNCELRAPCRNVSPCGQPVEREPNDPCPVTHDSTELAGGVTIFATICPAGDEDLFLWNVTEGFRSILTVASGDSCNDQPSSAWLGLLDPNTCEDASGGQGESPFGWMADGPAQFLVRAAGESPNTVGKYRLSVTATPLDFCRIACQTAAALPSDTTVTVNTCGGCGLYPGTFEDACQGPQWVSGLQSFFSFALDVPRLCCFSVVGDSTEFPGGQDVQFQVFTDCRDPDGSCVFSQDRNFPGNEVTGPAHTEYGCTELPPGAYILGVSSYDVQLSGNTCATMWVRLSQRCDPVSDLCCMHDRTGAGVLLTWTCQTAGTCQVWSTASRVNDGDPDGGEDPDWYLETDLVVSPGPVSWLDTSPVVPYKNYIVVNICQ